MKLLGKCCRCEKDLYCLDDLNFPDNIRGGCSVFRHNGEYYVIGEYGSSIFDTEQGIITDKELTKTLKGKKRIKICDKCIHDLIEQSLLEVCQDNYLINIDNSDDNCPYFNDPKKFRGEELFSLWETCFVFLLPRLKKFRDWVGDYPFELQSNEKWKEVLGEMIWYVETTIQNNNFPPKDPKEAKRYRKAERLFVKYFFHLWG